MITDSINKKLAESLAHSAFKIMGNPAPDPKKRDTELRQAIATVLVHAALTDANFAPAEREVLQSALKNRLKLSEDEAMQLLAQAEHGSQQSTLVASVAELNKQLGPEQREQVMVVIWAIIAADNLVSKDEAAFAASLRHSLGLSIEQGLHARKLAEGVVLDGFKEVVEADDFVVSVIRGLQKWRKAE